jgi:hypothetical protein
VQLGPGAGAAATSGWFRAFEQAGVRVLQPIPPRAFAVHGPRSSLERLRDVLPIAWIGPFDPRWKIQPRLAELLVAREKNRRGDASSALPPKADVVVQCFAGLGVSLGAEEARPDVLPALAAAGLRPRWISRVRNRWHLRLDAPLDLIPAIARWDSVFRVELFPEYRLFGERENVASAGAYADTATCVGPGYREWLAKKGANGRGVIVQVQDDGIEQGDATGRAGTAHPDLLGTIAGVDNATSDVLGDSGAGHGSINAGIVAGTGATGWTDASGFEPGLGIAPEAQVFGTKIFANNSRFDVNSRSFSDLAAAAVAAGCSVSSNSWGALFPGDYDFAAAEFDALARDAHPAPGQQPLTLVFSAGNAGDFFEDSLGTVGSPAIAKNVISVGAGESCDADGTDGCEVDATGADSVRDLIAFSSRGPLADGRLGVTVLAPGTHVAGVASTAANYDGTGVCDKYWPEGQTLYARSSGTSHSAPQVAGAAALFLDKIARESGELPSPALVRAAIAGSARDRAGGSDGFGGVLPPRPDPQQGWGSLKIDELIDDEAGLPKSLHFDGPAVFTESGQEWEAIVFVIDPAKPLRVALAWTDPPAMPGANPALVNDLDLEVDVGGVTYVGNVFSGGFSTEGGEPDRLNNLECVFVEQPSGSAIVRVRAANIQGDGIPGNFARVDQDFAVSVFGATDQSSAGAVTLRGNAFSCSAKAGLARVGQRLAGRRNGAGDGYQHEPTRGRCRHAAGD